MILGRVLGSLWASAQLGSFEGTCLKLVVPVDGLSGREEGEEVLAVDLVGSRAGDLVLVVYEGSSARLALADEATPCEAIVVGIVDRLEVQVSGADGRSSKERALPWGKKELRVAAR